MAPVLSINKTSPGQYICSLNLQALYNKEEIKRFNEKWSEFLDSDEWNKKVFERDGEIITYTHKSWIPEKQDSRPSLLVLGGNPAPHSVYENIAYTYEKNGNEHRFWKVMREVGIIDLEFNLEKMRDNFFSLNYKSPFRIGMEAVITFPSSASAPKWSGVAGIEKLFGVRAFRQMYEEEKRRISLFVEHFLGESGAIMAMQKDAYNAVANNTYNVKKAVTSELVSTYGDTTIKIYGTPPTRWLYTKKMKKVLRDVRDDILRQ